MTLQTRLADDAEVEVARQAAEVEALLAAEALGTALRASPEFGALLAAGTALEADAGSTAAIGAFQRRQAGLRMPITLGTLSDAERAELEGLQAAVLACPAVAAYFAAQTTFAEVCRETAAIVTNRTGIDFAANSRSGGCCG